MRNNRIHIFLIVLLLLIFPGLLPGQTWKFIKASDGVQLYTCQEAGKRLKLFKGVGEINESADKVFALLGDVNNTEWWTKDVTHIKVLLYQKGKHAEYYLVYHLPWPFKDRDLCVNLTATINRSTGERKLTAVPLSGVCAENKEFVRVNDYWQESIIRPIDKHRSLIELEFYINPGSNLPNWLLNMVLGEAPINMIKALRIYMETGKQ
jgi:hypothetical protein